MKYLSAVTILSSVLIFISCGNNSNNDTVYTAPESASINNTISDTSVNSGMNIPDLNNSSLITTPTLNNLPVSNTPQPVSLPAASAPASSGLNPEHGKPGHRCDIAVGAPLNSAPASQPAATVTNTPSVAQKTTPIITAPQPSPAATTSKTVAAGMNPEHGKPGHRCDIAVGAPLDSKPIEAKIEQKTEEVKTETPVTPLLPAANPDGATLNPEHGKPGHRCDIAVGAPLPKQ